jgi:hypothetical protein
LEKRMLLRIWSVEGPATVTAPVTLTGGVCVLVTFRNVRSVFPEVPSVRMLKGSWPSLRIDTSRAVPSANVNAPAPVEAVVVASLPALMAVVPV